MKSNKQALQLAELIRILQGNNYTFSVDPQVITQVLRQEKSAPATRLLRRAQLIDRDGELTQRLQHTRQYLKIILWLASLFFLIGGFISTFALMGKAQINFFSILLSVLGVHTLMLFIWIIISLRSGSLNIGFLFKPSFWLRKQDPISQAICQWYSEKLSEPAIRWYLGKISHRFWLCTLMGIWLAVWLLFLVRQYHFTWESTLLSEQHLIALIGLFSWLPEQLGFTMPKAQTIINSHATIDLTGAKSWANLLLISIFIYGIVPRALAYFVCAILWRKHPHRLPLNLPYYQNLIQFWQKKIVDADNENIPAFQVALAITLSDAPKWACMLENKSTDPQWHRNILGQIWQDKGQIDSRESFAQLQTELDNQAIQLLIGINAHTLPDRGILRQISTLANKAQGGIIIQLLSSGEQNLSASLKTRLEQWHNALQPLKIAWFDPPQISQHNSTEEHT